MQTQGNGALPHEEARQGANPKEAVALLAELLGQLGDVLGHDLFNLATCSSVTTSLPAFSLITS